MRSGPPAAGRYPRWSAELRPDWAILVEDLDPYRHLTERWPGNTLSLRLVDEGQAQGDVRFIDTGPGDTPAFVQALERADDVAVPVRPEPMSAQEFLPVKDGAHRQALVQDALREGWDAPTARAAVRKRCDSQQEPDTVALARAAARRSRAVVRQVQQRCRVLADGSAASLSAESP